MASQPRDPLEDFIADGRLRVDLEVLHSAITSRMHSIYLADDRFATRYGVCNAADEACLKAHISTMADYAVGQAYNRLRGILKMKAYSEVGKRMKTRCPVPKDMEFPAWISSLIGSIGSIRVTDGPGDALLVYATSAATMNRFGRTNDTTYTSGHYNCLLGVMKEIGITLAPVDHNNQTGSAFPTIAVELKNHIFTLHGTLHHSHYDTEDTVRAIFCTDENGVTPFEQIGITIGYVDDEATINALASADAPKGIPEGQTSTSAGRPVAGHFDVNYFGIRPPVPATETAESQPAGMYVIGRGVERYYQCILAHSLSVGEFYLTFRFRLTGCN
ncbi:uncharacterized protein LOC141710516 [Apium graveolens]|uniref:uncharacterized protein LOC141710516 n=1 Tax=Apium graveolens TaxID=4045 RepID=UPI003D7A0370